MDRIFHTKHDCARQRVLVDSPRLRTSQKQEPGLTRRHELPELLRNNDAFFGLVILQDGAHHARGGAHGGVQHVHELRLRGWGANAEGVKHLRSGSPRYPGLRFPDLLTLSIIFLVCP